MRTMPAMAVHSMRLNPARFGAGYEVLGDEESLQKLITELDRVKADYYKANSKSRENKVVIFGQSPKGDEDIKKAAETTGVSIRFYTH